MIRKTLKSGTIAVGVAVLTSCGPFAEVDSANDGSADGSQSGPSLRIEPISPQLLGRMINPDLLQLRLLVNGNPVSTVRDSVANTWSASFDLPESGEAQLAIEWLETVTSFNQQIDITLGRVDQEIAPLTANSSRTIVIEGDAYRTAEFDFDNDTISNIDERNANTDPINPTEPGNTGVDCRQENFQGINFPVQPFEFITSREVPFNFGEGDIQLSNIPGLGLTDQTIYFDSYLILRPGVLTITHTVGTPEDTTLELFKRVDGQLRNFANGDTVGERAQQRIDVEPGIYCMQLRPGPESVDRTLIPGTTVSRFDVSM